LIAEQDPNSLALPLVAEEPGVHAPASRHSHSDDEADDGRIGVIARREPLEQGSGQAFRGHSVDTSRLTVCNIANVAKCYKVL
jgi:hypothetical protein